MFKCSVISTCSDRSIKIACSAFVNREIEDCNPTFQLEMEYRERLGSVTGVRHSALGLTFHFFELPEK